jgi:hypothetical protein
MSYRSYSDDFAAAMFAAERQVKADGCADLMPQDVLAAVVATPDARAVFAAFAADVDLVADAMAHPVAGLAGRRHGAYAGPSDDFKDLLILTLQDVANHSGEAKAGVLDYVAALAQRRPAWFVDAMAMLGIDTAELLALPAIAGRGADGVSRTSPTLATPPDVHPVRRSMQNHVDLPVTDDVLPAMRIGLLAAPRRIDE